ncbi:SurA N-terminal domain-containing protein [Dokdonella sp. MW10]|uniref:SurA N-terminal domain-containing protein n=1 Tax=Dokdonella sp. MW10 TaxID=2992926 RepID=UPI003F7E4F80
MLQALREKTSGLIAKIILGAVIIAFSFFGIESYFIAQTDDYVARVGDKEVSQQEFRSRFDEFRQMQMQRSNGALDARYFESPEVKRQVLDQLIDEKVMLAANERLGVVVPVDRLRQEIMRIPAFQSNGQFDPALYRAALASQGMTPSMFDVRVRDEIATREMPVQVATSAIVTDADVDTYLRLRGQLRDFRFVALPKASVEAGDIKEEDIAKYYTEHQQDFMIPEEVALEYVDLEADKVEVALTPDEATLRKRYEDGKARFVSPEQRLASHILVKVGGKGGPDDQKAALEKAQKLAADAREGKTSFADLAKQSSEDLGSKALGGDLGWVDKEMTDPAFEAALYALEKGKISDPVLSGEGYHVIELRDVRPGSTRSFEEVRPELVREYGESERERVYSEKSGRLIDVSYQDSTSLEPAARAVGLPVQKTALFSREGATEGFAANPAVVRAAFSDQVLLQGNNSDSIEIAPNHVAVVRVAEHKPASPKPLDEVRDDIRRRLVDARTAELGKQRADELFARLGKDTLDVIATETGGKVADEKGIGRNAVNLDSALVTAVFAMPRPQGEAPSSQLVAMSGGEYALVQLDKVADADPKALDEPTREAARNTLQQASAMGQVREFLAALRANTEIKRAEERM